MLNSGDWLMQSRWNARVGVRHLCLKPNWITTEDEDESEDGYDE